MPARPAAEDFLSFDHPVRELPDFLADFERRSRGQERTRGAESGPADEAEQEAFDRRLLRVRRWAVLGLAAAAGIFLYLERAGIEPEAFSRHAPMLAVAVLVVVGGTFRPVPPSARKSPVGNVFAAAIAFWFIAGLLLQLKGLYPERAALFQALYMGLGAIALLAAVWVHRRPLTTPPGAADEAPPGEPSTAGVYGSRQRVVAACREALERIGRHAPRGARAVGWLDLAGPEVDHKLVGDDRQGKRYQDTWWRLRLPWEDGVRLRLVGQEDVLVRRDGEREGTWTLRAKLSVDRRRWSTVPGPFDPASAGPLKVEGFEVTPSRVSARIVTREWAFQPDDLVDLIRVLEERVRPLAATGGEA